ncbi:MAG: hypothetical protein IKP60_04665 [Treponema sp.]|nr:hypothetical protein [Treponema sp.]
MKVFLKLVGALALTSTLFFSCASTSGQVKDGKYIGQYDETMTPENSCVIFFSFQGNQISEFKQINTKKDIDTQSFEYGLLNIWDMTVFKPCKPGSRYMLTKFQGSIGGGWSRDYWDMELKPSEQYLVIDVPNEPGIYCFEIIRGDSLAYSISDGKKFEISKADSGKNTKSVYKAADGDFKRLYGNTPWYDAFIEKKEQILNKAD